jgi:arylsulfatase A-like enzyme
MKQKMRRLIELARGGDPGGADELPGLLPMALWFGLVTGLLETALRLGQRAWEHRVTVASIRTNRHWIWMTPASHVMLFVAIGLLLALAARFGPRAVITRAAPWLYSGIASLALLLTFEGLYLPACLILACGLATPTASLIRRRARGFRRLVVLGTPALALVALLLACVVGSRVVLAERRAIASLPAPPQRAPNVLLIVLDDVRADDLGLYGYPRDTTPNLGRLARRGIRFDEARATAPWTLPSHASMFTGRWPHELSVRVDRPLDATHPTLAGYLADRGYEAAGFVGNTFYCNAWYGLDRGFARYEDFRENRVVSPLEVLRSSILGRRLVALAGMKTASPGSSHSRKTAATINGDVLAWLGEARDRNRDRDRDRPFFVFLNYYDAHAPFQPPAGFDRSFGLAREPLATRESILRSYSKLRNLKSTPSNAPEVVDKASRLLRDSYDGCIAYLDEQVGQLFGSLERRGLLDNTLVIVTSDHGEHFGEAHLFGHGQSLYRPLIHVPLLIFPPGSLAARRGEGNANANAEGEGAAPASSTVIHEPVTLRNLAATVVDLLKLPGASPFPGRSLARHWEGAPAPPGAEDEPILAEVEHQKKFRPNPFIPASLGPLQSLVADRRVYIHNSDGREEVYDLEHDLEETRNLSGLPETTPLLERFRHDLARALGETTRR